ncbi:FxsA family protein [Rhodococcus rhodnii]|uniref:FxsA family protein n=1 Tax=Rhodococcus rhodnii TaxID=38312 RepID=UPI00039FA9B1|nr:FxsA family protein [Rhodococcus rhodnii]
MPALFVLYVVTELAALLVTANFIGAGWTVLLLLAGTLVGLALLRSQWRRVMEGFRSASQGRGSPGSAVADGALVAAGSVLMVVPGLVTSVLGLLCLLPFTRMLMRPLAVAVAGRRGAAVMAGAGVYGRMRRPGGGDVIDGEVVAETHDTPEPGTTRADDAWQGRVLEGEIIDPADDQRRR